MKFKYFTIFLFLFLLVCSANAIYAATDDNILELDQSDNIISTDNNVQLSQSDTKSLAASQDEIISTDNQETVLTDSASESTSTSTTVSPIKKFNKDITNQKSEINLTGDIKITKPFDIRFNTVINGQGHIVDGQKQTRLFEVRGSTVTFKNFIFKNGKSNQGAAIYGSSAIIKLKNCTFLNNKVTDNGGAVYITSGKINVDKSTFQNNFAKNNGGAIYATGSSVVIKNSLFKKNLVKNGKSRGHGGAVYTYKKSSLITNSKFISNYCLSTALKKHSKATKYQFTAGAIYYNVGGTHTLKGCTFIGNKASNHGGAIYYFKPKKGIINNCTFKSNKVCYEDGGAITFNGNKLTITKSTFIKNHAYEDGGVMDTCTKGKNKVRVIIKNTLFDGNYAYKGGGCIWMGVKTYYTMKNNKFINNEAGMGGAFFCEDGRSKVTNCIFQGNKARNIPKWQVHNKGGRILKNYGGAVLMQNKKLQLIKCTFIKNRANAGGAIFHMGGKLVLSKNKFSANKAKKGAKIQKG